MRPSGNRSRRRTPVAAVMLAVFLQACTRWTPVPLEPVRVPAVGPIRVTLRTGQVVIIKSPVVSGDTLREASTEGVTFSRPQPRPPGIPLAQITRIDVQQLDAGGTVAVVVLGGLILGAVIVVVVLKSFEAGFE